MRLAQTGRRGKFAEGARLLQHSGRFGGTESGIGRSLFFGELQRLEKGRRVTFRHEVFAANSFTAGGLLSGA
jgi:hypothetical protein